MFNTIDLILQLTNHLLAPIWYVTEFDQEPIGTDQAPVLATDWQAPMYGHHNQHKLCKTNR